jgi:hypothetical protein
MRARHIVTAVVAVSFFHSSFADNSSNSQKSAPSTPSASPASAVPNDLTNYQGDRVTFNTDLIVRVQKDDGTAGDLYCIPAHVKLRGGVGYSASGDAQQTETGTLFRLLKDPPQPVPPSNDSTGNAQDAKQPPQDVTTSDSGPLSAVFDFLAGTPKVRGGCTSAGLPTGLTTDWHTLSRSVDLRVSEDTIDRSPPNRYGLTYGLLAVPFKYHLTGAKEFTGAATVGPYFGYRTLSSSNGYGISYVGFLGYSNISVMQTVNGQSASQNLASISYGVGAIATVKGNFQLGGVVGFDHVSKDSNYAYNDKPWLAIELGYSFLQ